MITVIAGVNGAGKSSLIGANIRSNNGEYFNPDEVSRSLMLKDPLLSLEKANSKAWKLSYEQLKCAILEDKDYVFETTLGGNSICQLLHDAIDEGIKVRILFCGLESAELHIQRVKNRVAKGGHDIPEDKIRARWKSSILNMMSLIPRCYQIKVFDNSSPVKSGRPKPVSLFSMLDGKFIQKPIKELPEWAKPIASVAIKTAILRSD